MWGNKLEYEKAEQGRASQAKTAQLTPLAGFLLSHASVLKRVDCEHGARISEQRRRHPASLKISQSWHPALSDFTLVTLGSLLTKKTAEWNTYIASEGHSSTNRGFTSNGFVSCGNIEHLPGQKLAALIHS